MNKNEIMTKVSKTFGRAGLKLKKHSPEILIVTGVIGIVTSAVLACRATTKISTVLVEKDKAVERIHIGKENGMVPSKTEGSNMVPYSEEDAQKDLTITYVQTGLKIAKLYAPSVILGVLSLTGIVASNQILRKRNIAIAAAYATLDKGFKEYRARVAERFGDDVEREIRFNVKAEEVEVKTIDEDGNETVEKKIVETAKHSTFARVFDETNPNWQRNAEDNLYFLRCHQSHLNDLLKLRGHVFLNEVYDEIGITRSKAGQIVGWIYDPDNPKTDSFIDFGIYDANDKMKRMFVNGDEQSIWLDFNVDGIIYDLI